MKMRLSISIAIAVLGAATLSAQTKEPDLLDTNCTQFTRMLRNAQPGTTPEEKVVANSAQEELIVTMFWVHGYVSGRAGTPPALNRTWLTENTRKLADKCSASGAGKMRIIDAAKGL